MLKLVLFFLKKQFFAQNRKKTELFFSYGGIIISVAVLTMAMSLFEGYQKALQKAILGVNSHVYIFRGGPEELYYNEADSLKTLVNKLPEVAISAEAIKTQVMLSAKNQSKGCLLKGIDDKQKILPADYKKYVVEGLSTLNKKNSIILGQKLAFMLGLKVNDEFYVLNPAASKYTPMGLKTAKKKCKLTGIVSTGMYDYDLNFAYTNLSTADFFSSTPNRFNVIEIQLKDEYIDKADDFAFNLQRLIGHKYQVKSWKYYNGSLFSMLKMQQWMLFAILSCLVLISSFNMVSTVSAFIIKKQSEIGILKAMGATNHMLKLVYLGQIFITALSSVTIGIGFGYILSIIATKQTVIQLKGDVYFIENLVTSFNLSSIIIVLVTSLFIVIASSIIPLQKISKLEVKNIIRN